MQTNSFKIKATTAWEFWRLQIWMNIDRTCFEKLLLINHSVPSVVNKTELLYAATAIALGWILKVNQTSSSLEQRGNCFFFIFCSKSFFRRNWLPYEDYCFFEAFVILFEKGFKIFFLQNYLEEQSEGFFHLIVIRGTVHHIVLNFHRVTMRGSHYIISSESGHHVCQDLKHGTAKGVFVLCCCQKLGLNVFRRPIGLYRSRRVRMHAVFEGRE